MQKQVQILLCSLLAVLACLGLGAGVAWGQATTTGGSLVVTVTDPSGAAIPGAALEVKDLSTNDIRRATTQANGVYTFINLPGGTYSMTVSAQGFANQVFESVVIRTSLETPVKAELKVGTTTESVTVTASEVPLVQTEASAIATNFDTKQVFNLPQYTRNTWGLVYNVPGYASGTFNNLPGAAIVAADFDGVQSMSNRFREGGYTYGTSVIDPRLENIAEFTVATSQLDLSGNGTSAMKISIVTKRGTNEYHGILYEDFRNTVLNANTWSNNANVNAQGVGTARSITKYNNFGGSAGGPILRNKLFFFGTFSMQKNPNTSIQSRTILNPLAQQGIYQYFGPTGAPVQVPLFQMAGIPVNKVNSVIASQLSRINSITSGGLVTPSASDPNVSTYRFTLPSTATNYYPMFKLDYNATDKLRFTWSYNQQKSNSGLNNAPNWLDFDKNYPLTTYSAGNNKIISLGNDYTITPSLFNHLQLGYLYQFSSFSPEGMGIDLPAVQQVNWASGTGTGPYNGYPFTAISSLYSQYSIKDDLTWQRGKHQIVAGFSGFREWDRYWNGPGGWPNFSLGVNSNDPAYAAINSGTQSFPGMNTTFQGSARNLYATLAGDVSGVSIAVGRPLDWKTKNYKPFGQYNLNEVQQSEGFWIQDRWRFRPTLTINYGLRWDIVHDDYNKDGAYTSAASLADLYGPTTLGAMFQPGALGGVGEPSFTASQHKYKTMWKNPQPAIAFAWNPAVEGGVLGKLLGHNKTVIRTGYSLRNYQPGAQDMWSYGSQGLFFYQQGSAAPDPSQTGPGYFKPGSLYVGNPTPVPDYLLNPQTWSPTIPGSQMFGSSAYAINPNIRLPYVQSWNFGIQREIGASALEVNYVGNLTLHSWLGMPLNEINIFENGFLQEFQNAQKNLAINQANGKGNSAYNYGLPGQVALPIFTAAFGNAGPTSSVWTGLYTNLVNGAAGSQARTMVSTTSYLCNIIGGANFKPCAGYAGAGKPLNFWNINPYSKTGQLYYLDAAGMANYHALQAQWRTRYTHGAQFTFNYTLAHSLANGSQSHYQDMGYSPYTLRNLQLNYAETGSDIRQAVRIVGTYDLPFGKGKWLDRGGVIDAIVGSWTLGTITSITTAGPSVWGGGYSTVTGSGSGIVFQNGMTAKQFQDSITQQRTGSCSATGCSGWVQEFSPYLASNGTADPKYFVYNTTPGVWGAWPTIRGPLSWNSDMSVTKRVPIHERYRFMIQATATNVFNHPNIGLGNLSLTSTSFGRVTPGGNRQMVLRANLEF